MREISRREMIARRLLAIYEHEKERNDSHVDSEQLFGRIKALVPDIASQHLSAVAEEPREMFDPGSMGETDLQSEIEELLLNLEEECVREEMGELLAHLRELEESGEKEKSSIILLRSKELAERISSLHKRKASLNG